MKTKALMATVLVCLIFSCSDDDNPYTCSTCVDTPEAIAANDASGKGIYKGLVVGSSGTIKFNIANNGSTIEAVLILDGKTIALTTDDTYSLANGFEGYFYNDAEGIEIGFYVLPDGTEYYAFYIDIPGHPDAIIEVVKELSTGLVRVFEGDYKGSSSGTFNLMTRSGNWAAVSDSDDYFGGEYDGQGNLSCDYGDCSEVEVTGKITGDEVTGEWKSLGNTDKGSWSGKRTL